MTSGAALPVHEPSQIGEARRAATGLAEQLHFSVHRAGQVGLVTSELASNLAKHARGGEILIRPLDDGCGSPPAGIEILSLDKGPGIPDIALSSQDGYSTVGSLGNGLGAVRRQADSFDLFTQPAGTAAVAQIWRDRASHATHGAVVGAVQVVKAGEDVCGDAWAWRAREDRLAILLADGLGHGLYAHTAACQAVDTFGRRHDRVPLAVVQEIHAALRPTRGAAVASLAAEIRRDVLHYCGLGNISAHVFEPSSLGRCTLVSHNGTAGHSARRIQEFSYPLGNGNVIVMHSDGLSSHWNVAAYPGILTRHPSLLAGVLYRDFSRGLDDVTVVVARIERTRQTGGLGLSGADVADLRDAY